MNLCSKLLTASLLIAGLGALGVPSQTQTAAAADDLTQPVTRWVDNDSPAPTGPRACARAQFDTIQAAVDASSPGDVVRVCPGTYVENVVVLTDDLTIVSTDGSGVTSVQAPASPSPYLAAWGYNHVFYVRARDVTVSRLTIVPAGVADPDIGVNVANEGWTGFKLTHSRVIGGRIGVNLGCASSGSRIGHNELYRQTESAINVDTCEMSTFPGSRLNDVHHNYACAPVATFSIALGQGSDLNDIHHNTVRSISVHGTGNAVHDNTTQLPVVDNGTLSLLFGNAVDPSLCS